MIESLLPEVQAALDENMSQDDLEASLYEDEYEPYDDDTSAEGGRFTQDLELEDEEEFSDYQFLPDDFR